MNKDSAYYYSGGYMLKVFIQLLDLFQPQQFGTLT